MSLEVENVVAGVEGEVPQQRVADFQLSETTGADAAGLIHRLKTVGLTEDESAELNHYLQIEHLMRLAKARARQGLAGR